MLAPANRIVFVPGANLQQALKCEKTRNREFTRRPIEPKARWIDQRQKDQPRDYDVGDS